MGHEAAKNFFKKSLLSVPKVEHSGVFPKLYGSDRIRGTCAKNSTFTFIFESIYILLFENVPQIQSAPVRSVQFMKRGECKTLLGNVFIVY